MYIDLKTAGYAARVCRGLALTDQSSLINRPNTYLAATIRRMATRHKPASCYSVITCTGMSTRPSCCTSKKVWPCSLSHDIIETFVNSSWPTIPLIKNQRGCSNWKGWARSALLIAHFRRIEYLPKVCRGIWYVLSLTMHHFAACNELIMIPLFLFVADAMHRISCCQPEWSALWSSWNSE